MSVDREDVPRFSHQPSYALDGMIKIFEPAKITAIQRHVSTSSASSLDRLPLELLHSICASLDFQSLSRLSCTSFRNKAIVESLPAYRDLMKYASHTLSALGKTRLIGVHSSAKLHATLRSANCISCGEYGAFLFLPTCERCCYQCLWRNQSLWVIPESVARKCFSLTQRQLKTIPVMYNMPGEYFVRNRISRRRRLRLFCVKSVKSLAIAVHGSEEKVTKLAPAKPTRVTPDKAVQEYYKFKWLLEAPLRPFPKDPLTMPLEANKPSDEWCGTASIYFPSLSPPNSVETGYWCFGCKHTYDFFKRAKLGPEIVSDLVAPGVTPCFWFHEMLYRARSKSEHLHHTQHCYGVQQLISRGDSGYH